MTIFQTDGITQPAQPETAFSRMLQALKYALPHISQEVEDRKFSGNDEPYADLETVELIMSRAISEADNSTHERRTSQKAVYVTYRTNSTSPRAKRWYGIRIAGYVDGEIYPIGHMTTKGPITAKKDAMAQARTEAKKRGWPLLEGIWRPGANNVLEQIS